MQLLVMGFFESVLQRPHSKSSYNKYPFRMAL